MGVVMQVINAQLVLLCFISFASAVQGSAGYNISPSTENFSAITPIEAEPPAHQMKPLNSSLPSSSLGSTSLSPLAAPPLFSSSPSPDQRSTVENAPSSISQPSGSMSQPPLASPPLSASPPPKTTELVPFLSPSNPNSSFSHPLAPPPMSIERGALAPPPSESPEKAPVQVTPAVSLAPAPTLTPTKHPPAYSPVDNDSIPVTFPPAGHKRNDSVVHSPVPEASVPASFPSPPRKIGQSPPAERPMMPHITPPMPPVPAASPSKEGILNSPSVHPHAPKESPSGHHISPASTPLKKKDKMPAAPPSNNAPTDLAPGQHPPKGSFDAVSPSVHKASAPAPSLLPPPSEGHHSPASLPPVSFVNHHHARKAVLPPSHSPLPSKGSSGGIAPSPHKTGHISADAPLPPPLPSSKGHHFSAYSPLPSSNKQRKRGKKISSPPPFSDHSASSPGPVSAPATLPKHKQRHNAPPSPSPGSLVSPPHFANPPLKSDLPPAPSPSPKTAPGHPKISPSKPPLTNLIVPPPPPIRALPPPPPNEDCSTTTCTEPYTNTPPGSPCGCVWPMQVGLRLNVALYTFFPLVSELAEEIASGVFMKQSQVRIMGANAATEQPEKTVVLIDLVPLGNKFDNTTAFLTFERFWHKQIFINASYFGDYEVLYVRYPGLPASPPLPPDASMIDGGPYSGNDNNARTNKPLGVDVQKGQHNHGLSGGAVAIIVLSALVAIVLCSVAGWIWIMKHRDRVVQPAPAPQALLPSVAKSPGSILGSGPSSASLSFGSSLPTYAGSAKTYSVSDIEKATDHFNESRVLGEGGFGRVYSGILEDGTKVAVKVLKREDQQGGREFLAEIEMLSRLHHRNLVKLIGICAEERVRCLVYELIPNGSVESHLHGVDKEAAPLDWGARMKIALGSARGLAYLHEDSSPRVIHRDFKASNILLEHDFTPKVSDFGLARTAMDEENRHISTRVMGTFGYVAPEYAMTGHLLVKSDVYSYGVVLLELLTGRKPVDMSQPPGQENLVAWARPLLTSREGLEAMLDQSLGPNVPFDSVAKVAAIASMCVQPEVSHRPFMGEVVQALKLVCNECECDESREAGSRSSSREDLSIELDPRAGAGSGQLEHHPLQGRYSDPDYGSVSNSERGMLVSDFPGTSTGYTRPISGPLRRYSSSGPMRAGRGRHFWERLRTLSGGSASEHGSFLGLWPGSN
ncbi:hypothetical protein ACJRO7_016117 [Eucalyptus globulus]|uniref:Protein kinase domain-containing protein n=1 Tax=Eucalyptus globulus TaxID=34317 RepID=A0ABD3L741_EUCGL